MKRIVIIREDGVHFRVYDARKHQGSPFRNTAQYTERGLKNYVINQNSGCTFDTSQLDAEDVAKVQSWI
jgi:hypothetical protein